MTIAATVSVLAKAAPSGTKPRRTLAAGPLGGEKHQQPEPERDETKDASDGCHQIVATKADAGGTEGDGGRVPMTDCTGDEVEGLTLNGQCILSCQWGHK